MNAVKVEWFIVMLGGLGWVVRMLECSARVISIVCDMMDICRSGIASKCRFDEDRGCTLRRAARSGRLYQQQVACPARL